MNKHASLFLSISQKIKEAVTKYVTASFRLNGVPKSSFLFLEADHLHHNLFFFIFHQMILISEKRPVAEKQLCLGSYLCRLTQTFGCLF